MATVTINTADDEPPPLSRLKRAQLVDRVVLECARDLTFAQQLADNLAAAGVLPPALGQLETIGRPEDWGERNRIWLIAFNAALTSSKMPAEKRFGCLQEAVRERTGKVLSARTLANYLTDFRRQLREHPDLKSVAGPKLRRHIAVNHNNDKR